MTIWVRIRNFVGSVAGRVFLFLTIGMVVASTTSLLFAERARQRDFEQAHLQRVAASAIDVAQRVAQSPAGFGELLARHQILGAQLAPPQVALVNPDPDLIALLRLQLGPAAEPEAGEVPGGLCFPQFDWNRRAAGMVNAPTPDCWIVRFTDPQGTRQSLAISLPPLTLPRSSTLDPVYLLILVAASAILALIVARVATSPIRRLADATRSVSISATPDPLPEVGPSEVRAALHAFNVMQQRIREGVRERTQVLAAISHDLQTPLTRLRLRLEQVEDPVLRARLASDLAATRSLVHEGLELARSSESYEPFSAVDIDSLVSSIVEDAGEFGASVSFIGGCGVTARVKPNALARCLGNLIDNAIKYGGGAEVRCEALPRKILITVRDRGPGIPPERIDAMFQPFERGENSRSRATGGTGLGLTIALAQAGTFGATVDLQNHDEQGLVASISIPFAP